MAKYGDRHNAGRSAIVPYRPGERAMDRHQRRLVVNLDHEGEARAWCEANGVRFRITNDGHHWRFDKQGHVIEWWPSSAKLVINKRWDRGVHTHDYQKALAIVERHFREVRGSSASRGSPTPCDSQGSALE